MQVTMVPNEQVEKTWPQIEPYMEGAAKHTYGRFTADDIREQILHSGYYLWIAYDEKSIKGAVVTNFTMYPHKKYLDMVFTGGIDIKDWKDPMLTMLRSWAKVNECDGIESTGRPGWAKIFKQDGHNIVWHTYELPLDTGE